jgi:hypothetical protein
VNLLPKWSSIRTELAAADIIGVLNPWGKVAINELHYFFD